MLINPAIKNSLLSYKAAVEVELASILDWWMEHMVNKETGFFYGEVSSTNQPDAHAPIGLVLQSRLLWTFSTSFKHTNNQAYLNFAHKAYQQLLTLFYDKQYGGMFWSVHPSGVPVSTKKQAYGIAFAIYGLAAYYEAAKNQDALDKVAELYSCLEKNFYDPVYGGYIESLGNDFSVIEDVRLSDKDQNAIKSMNTHLHVIEAYAMLYVVLPTESLKRSIEQLLDIFEQHIIDATRFQQQLFFEKNWTCTSALVSYGHDIEASWLLQEAAVVIGDFARIKKYINFAQCMAAAVARNLSSAGAVYNDYNTNTKELDRGIDWWPQAEAMVGFLNAFQNSGNADFVQKSLSSWALVQTSFKDLQLGEWHWGYNANGVLLKKEKAGFWKCPYHNSRACIEVAQRVSQLLK
jgi:mannobiose 2-epimerase